MMCNLLSQAKELNRRLKEEFWGNTRERSILLRYALDSNYLPEDIYCAVVYQNQANILDQTPWLGPLIWIRKFYETGDGMNFRSVLKNIPEIAHEDIEKKFWPMTWQKLGDEDDAANNRFLADCFVLHGGDDGTVGRTSRLWKILRKLVDQLRAYPDCIDPSLLIAEADDNMPRFIHYASEQAPQDFLAVLKALDQASQVEGCPWTERIASSAGWQRQRNTPTVSIGLQKNGNIIQHAVRIVQQRTAKRHNIRLKQGQGSANYPAENYEIEITATWLQKNGFNITETVEISVGSWHEKIQLLDVKDKTPTLFRMPANGIFCRKVTTPDHDDKPPYIQARRLILLTPISTKQPCPKYGQDPIPWRQIGSTQIDQQNAYLLDLSEMERFDAQNLTLDGNVICLLGSKPWIEVKSNLDSPPGRENRPTIFGHGVECIYHGPNENTKWEAAGGGAKFELDNGSIMLHVTEPLNQIQRVLIKKGLTTLNCVFLPEKFNDILHFEGIALDEGWRWEPEENIYHIHSLAKQGRIAGKLTDSTGTTEHIQIPLKRPTWWWTEAFGQNQSDLCERGTEQQIRRHWFHLWVPFKSAELRLDDSTLTSINGPGYWTKKLVELLPSNKFNNFDESSKSLTIHSPDSEQAFEIGLLSSLPDKACLGWRNNLRTLYIPSAQNKETFTIVAVGESTLVTQQIQVQKYQRINGDEFIPLDFEQASGEALWLFLWQGEISIPTDFQEFLQKLLIMKINGVASYRPSQILEISRQEIHQTPGECLIQWNQGQELIDKQKDQIANQLRLLDTLIANENQSPFSLIFDRFKKANLFTAHGQGSHFWWQVFQKEVTIENLCSFLENMLHSGFNWIAEPNWPEDTLGIIRLRLKKSNQSWTKGRKEELKKICPPLMDLVEISRGYPLFRSKDILLSHLDSGLVNPQNPQVFRVSFINSQTKGYKSGFGWQKIDSKGIHLHGINQYRPIDFSFNAGASAMDPHGNMCRLKLLISDENQAIHYLCDKMSAMDEALLGEEDLSRMNDIFNDAIASSFKVIGHENERSLAYLIRLCAQGFTTLAEDLPGQGNRAAIFQVAVLVRLHAWFRGQHPDDWPLRLNDHSRNYDFLCAITHQIWQRPRSRDVLCSDIAGFEWLLVWFHLG